MSIRDVLADLRTATLTDEGAPFRLQMGPGLTELEIIEFETTLGARLPDDYRELLSLVTTLAPLEIDFRGHDSFGSDFLPRAIPFAADGCGNFWVADVISERETNTTIYFACHDGPVILAGPMGMENYLQELVVRYGMPTESTLEAIETDSMFHVEGKHPGAIAHDVALTSSDLEIRQFAETLDGTFTLFDLRSAPPGMGFCWGRYGPFTDVRRHGDIRIFACAPPEPKPGFLKRLFGR